MLLWDVATPTLADWQNIWGLGLIPDHERLLGAHAGLDADHEHMLGGRNAKAQTHEG
jgi:hypothetical protein